MKRTIFGDEHRDYRETVRSFLASEVVPHHQRWEREGLVPRELFAKAARQGLLAMAVPERYGGAGAEDFRFNQIVVEEVSYAGVAGSGLGITLHNDICLPYFLAYCNEQQRERWLPGIADGSLIAALAMTEPGIGSDLASMSTSARREGDHYLVNGAKTFITNGINADLVILAVKTDPSERHRGISLLVVERGMEGFERGRNLEKIGHARAGHRRAVLRRRARAGREPAGGGGDGLSLSGLQPRPGAAVDRARRRLSRAGRPGLDARLRQGAHGLRPAARLLPGTRASRSPR